MPGVMCQMQPGRVNYFGIEASSSVTWAQWEPGREYTKNIVLKNLQPKMTKIKYKNPSSRYFTTLYPQPIALGAGNSFMLPITFRPLEKTVYEDQVEFIATEGCFTVPMKAVLPRYNVQVTDSVNFCLCAVDDEVQTEIEVCNRTDMSTNYQVECAEPFAVLSNCGILDPLASVMLPIAFRPKIASVFSEDLVIYFGPDFCQKKVVKLCGIGKYPHLSVSSRSCSSNRCCGAMETDVRFGCVYVGRTSVMSVEIRNHSAVKAPFCIDHPLIGPTLVEQVFRCKRKTGVVPPCSSITIPFSFTPLTAGICSFDYFCLRVCGSPSKSIIRCIGSSEGPFVNLSQCQINFSKVDSGDVVTRPLNIINRSETEATFQFQIDCAESVFKIDCLTGTLPPKSSKTILVCFAPVHPINYHRRVACLVHNQGVLFLDLLGTCHTEDDKPAVLQSHHIYRYKIHAQRGLSLNPPERLNAWLAECQLVVDECGALALPSQLENEQKPVELLPIEEYIDDGYHSDVALYHPHVSIDVHQVDFGCVTDLNSFECQTVSLTNHTEGKVTVVWTGDSRNVFSVSPVTVDILPQRSFAFRVAFRPDGHNKYFGSELECFAFYKSMRDYRLTEDITHCVPWCITLSATANTFLPCNEHFIPRFSVNPEKMSFTVISANDSAYRTFLLTNSGTTPILFDFERESTGAYCLKPTKGLLEPSSNQIFVVKFKPACENAVYRSTLRLGLNDSEKHRQDIMVYGKVELPDICLDNAGKIYFKPTCIGMTSQRTYGIRNLSRAPVCFEWRLKNEDSKVVSVEPACGIIQPNEKQYHRWCFKPICDQKYVVKATLFTRCQLQLDNVVTCEQQRQVPFTVRIIGEASCGQIICKEPFVDCGCVLVCSVTNCCITLANDSNCNLNYKLHVTQTTCGPYANEEVCPEPLALELGQMGGMLAARTKNEISVTIQPAKRITYQWDIYYTLICCDGDVEQSSECRHLCQFTITGIYPTMSVTDARCQGSMSGLSKKQLWNLFNLDTLNMFLDGDPSACELTYNVPTKHSLSRKPPIFTRAILEFNFSSAPVASEPCCVQLLFENNGPSVCIWDFLYPTDQQLELEYWAETGEYDNDELHQMKVMENRLFTIEPKKGCLRPGESCDVMFSYRHSVVGTDRLPVLLKLSYGREILVNFVGVTVSVDRPYIHFPSTRHTFSPVPIGETRGAVQVYEMYNGGAVPVKFELDTFPLRALIQDNYGHSIFECLNPKGEIQPGHTASIEWKFSPLEAKTYSVEVDVRIECGETAVITFIGVGFDKRHLGDTMPITDQSNYADVPSVQCVAAPGQLCFLNKERISFGNMPLFTRGRHAVVMTNRSTEHSACFTWHVTNDKDAKYLSIIPVSGSLCPGESVLLKITLTAFGIPTFYDVDLVCEVKNLTEQNAYECELSRWENERCRQMVEFSVTEKDPFADLRTCEPEYVMRECPPSCERHKSIEPGETVAPDSREILRYKTLPPIAKKLSCDDQKLHEKLKRRFDEKFWPKPVPPKSFLLHLGLTARTHDLEEFQIHFPCDFDKFFIDQTLCDLRVKPSCDECCDDQTQCPKPICCNQSEADTLALMLSNILRSLVDDCQFHEACQEVVCDPVPYFQQFCQERPCCVECVDCCNQTSHAPDCSCVANCVTDSNNVKNEDQRPAPIEDWSPSDGQTLGIDGTTVPLHSSQSAAGCNEFEFTATLEEVQAQEPIPETVTETEEEKELASTQKMKKMPEVCAEIESIIENTLMNIVQEAFHGEFSITARPRLLALPPRPCPHQN